MKQGLEKLRKELSYRLSVCYMEVYIDCDFIVPEYIEPTEESTTDIDALKQECEDKIKQLEDKLENTRQKAESKDSTVKT